MTAAAPPPLPADLNEGLKRLKMTAMRRLAPELLVTAPPAPTLPIGKIPSSQATGGRATGYRSSHIR